MVSSLDGMIAKKDNSVSWFEASSQYDNGVDHENPEDFLKKVDCYVMGSRTYEHALELSKSYGWAYGDKPTIVVTNRILAGERENIEFYSGDLTKLVGELEKRYERVWVVGGARLCNELIRLNLAHEIRLTILPILLGNGIPFFENVVQERRLNLCDVKAYKSGMVELQYELR